MVTALKLLPSDDLESQEKALAEITRAIAELANQADRKRQEIEATYRVQTEELEVLGRRLGDLMRRRDLVLKGLDIKRRSGTRINTVVLSDGTRILGIEECV